MPSSKSRRTNKPRHYQSKTKKRTPTPPNSRRSTAQQRQRLKTQRRKALEGVSERERERVREIERVRVRRIERARAIAHRRNLLIRGVALNIENLLENGGWEDVDDWDDMIYFIDDENISKILHMIAINGEEMTNEELDMLEGWVSDKINYR